MSVIRRPDGVRITVALHSHHHQINRGFFSAIITFKGGKKAKKDIQRQQPDHVNLPVIPRFTLAFPPF